VCGDAAGDALRGEAVALVHAEGEEGAGIGAEEAQDAGEESEGGHAVHIVVAIEDDALAAVDCLEDALDGGAHAREEEGVGEVLEAGIEEEAGRGGIREAAEGEETG